MSSLSSVRTGMIGIKIGMTETFLTNGLVVPVTLISVCKNVILQVKTAEKEGYDAVVVGLLPRNGKVILSSPLRGVASKAGISSFLKAKEFRLSNNHTLKVGDSITLDHFAKGQYVDISSKSIGKGFAGVIKRHGFSGLEASHGVSISHRAHGSTGQRQDPGRVFLGKKMAGHMGDVNVTKQNLLIVDVDHDLQLVTIKGAIPGRQNSMVFIRDAKKKHVFAANF